MIFPFSRKSNSEDQTTEIANEFSEFVHDGMIVILNGDLGAGKTFFIKKIMEKFLVTNANSPTFAIVNEYCGSRKFYHFDFFRINKESELHDIGIEDYFNDEESVIFIEWGNLFPGILPKKRIEIDIINATDKERIFNFIKYD